MDHGFAGINSIDELRQFFPIDTIDCAVDLKNQATPTREIFAILRRDNQNVLEKLHWGFVPNRARDTSWGHKMILARAETASSKPSFKDAFRKRRCLIVGTGFYEWKSVKGGKQQVFITLPDGRPFAFAGLWETWSRSPGPHFLYRSCAILTTQAADSFRKIHHRMPVILKPEFYETWLDSNNLNVPELEGILVQGRITRLISHAVKNR